MFIRVGNKLLNSRYVVEIRSRSHTPGEDNATIVLHDGTEYDGFIPESVMDALAEQIVRSPPGFEVCVEYHLDLDYGNDEEIPAQPAGWVELLRNPSSSRKMQLMGIALLHPPYAQ
jgi:hypothetical protein